MSNENQYDYENAARAVGWNEGGGYIFNTNVFSSWKEAVSWCGDDCCNENEHSSHVYNSWQMCCEQEGIQARLGECSTCHKPTLLTHLDGKDDGTGNYTIIECKSCYGPGFSPM